jgi:micrococcal nuclease
MNDIRSRRSFLGRVLSITVGVLLIAAVVLLIISFVTARSDLPVSPESASLPPPQVTTTSAPVALPPSPVSLTLPQGLERATVINVADGDTIEVSLNGQTERVRLIGVDTPETSHPSRPVECFGREASAFTREVLRGQTVLLEDDPTQDNRDRFNRLLRFVWLPDGRLVNYEIIAQGYGFEYTFRTPHRYQAQFKAAERAARQAQIGLWAPETCNGERIAADAITPIARTTPTVAPEATPLPPSFDGCRTEPNAALAPNLPVAIVAIDKRAEVVTLRTSARRQSTSTAGRCAACGARRSIPASGERWRRAKPATFRAPAAEISGPTALPIPAHSTTPKGVSSPTGTIEIADESPGGASSLSYSRLCSIRYRSRSASILITFPSWSSQYQYSQPLKAGLFWARAAIL